MTPLREVSPTKGSAPEPGRTDPATEETDASDVAEAAPRPPDAGHRCRRDGPQPRRVGLGHILQAYGPTASIRGIAEFGAVPTGAQVASLEALGLVVQPMRHVPLALVAGRVSAMQAAVTTGAADAVSPDDPIQLLDPPSSDAMGAALPRAAGFTGRGVTVAVVDSGCDASHPDLGDHVIHNIKLYSAEYANQPPDQGNRIVVPIEMGPYQNSDLGSGHGTHVAGIIAADSTTDAAG